MVTNTKKFLELKGKHSMAELTLDERVELLELRDFAYNDEVYRLFEDFILRPHLKELDEKFGVSHWIHTRGGGGMTGSDTTEVGVSVHREKTEKLTNKIARFFSPYKAVIKVSFWKGDINYDERYAECAKKMQEDYNILLRPRLGYEMNLERM